jgi:hypothetical protein
MSCEFKIDEKTQRHKDTEAQRRAIKNLGCASLCLCVFVPLCFLGGYFCSFVTSKRTMFDVVFDSPSSTQTS